MINDEGQIQDWIIFECVTGSQAYGTHLPTSDLDLKGVFVLPPDQFYGLQQVPQIQDEKGDRVYYELNRFGELLLANNPNLLEMLYTEEAMVRRRDRLFDLLVPEMFLSKKCQATFAGFALAQIRKARGLNKKIVNPMGEKRRGILEFCHVLEGQGSVSLMGWLERRGFAQKECGLVKVPHSRDVYGLYRDEGVRYRGIVGAPEETGLRLSSVEKGRLPIAWMVYNEDGYKRHVREYREYWEWVEKRNDARYTSTVQHGRNYDAKNLMHTFRLLDMAEEIAKHGVITVRRPNRDFLLSIRRGDFTYEDLVQRAEERIAGIDELFERSHLPQAPDRSRVEAVLIEIRKRYYAEREWL